MNNGAFQGVSVLIPAHDEADWLPACLDALCASAPLAGPVEAVSYTHLTLPTIYSV